MLLWNIQIKLCEVSLKGLFACFCWHVCCNDNVKSTTNKDKIMITANTPLGVVATEYSGATRILRSHGLDFCCGGNTTIGEACGENTD